MNRLMTCAVFLLFFPACKQLREKSKLAGHHEASTSNKESQTIGKQSTVPEYETSQAVIVTSDVLYQEHFKRTGPKLIDEILIAGAQVYMLTKYNESDAQIRSDLKNEGFSDEKLKSIHFI